MRPIGFLFFLLLLSFVACKKESEVYPIIYPGPYYPVYPGSWWTYLDNDSVVKTISSGSAYRLNCYRDSPYSYGTTTFSDPVYVPYLNGKPIYEYYGIVLSGFTYNRCYSKWHIISEEIGFEFTRGWTDPRDGIPQETFVVKKKYFNGKDSILVVEGYWIDPVLGNVGNTVSLEEYARGIGLIKKIIVDTLGHDTSYTRILTDYYISFDSTSLDHTLDKME